MALGPVTVRFESDNAGLNAGAAQAEAALNSLAAQAKALAAQMTATGLTADKNLNFVLRDMEAEARRTKTSLEQMGATVEETGAQAGRAHTGMSGITRELIVLGHEASQGRWTRLGGSLVVLAEYGGGAALEFVKLNPLIAAVGAAAAAAAAAIGYLAYQTYETGKAVRGLEFDAALHGFSLMGDASKSLLESVERLGNAGPSDARAFIEPFLALGPLGETLAAVSSQYLPLFVANGKTAKEAGDALSKTFVDLQKGGEKYIQMSRDLTDTQKAEGIAALRAGDMGNAYRIVLESQIRALAAVATEQRNAKIETENNAAAATDAISIAEGFATAEGTLEARTAAAAKRAKEFTEEVNRLILAVREGKDAIGDFNSAILEAGKVDKIGTAIEVANGKIEEFQRELKNAHNPADVEKLTRALEIEKDTVRSLNEQNQVGGQRRADTFDRDALKQREEAEKEWQFKNAATHDQALQHDAATFLAASNDEKLSLQQRHTAYEKYVSDEIALNNAAAKAGTKASRDVLADQQAQISGQISQVKEESQLEIDTIKDKIKLKIVSERDGTAAIQHELALQEGAVDDLYERWVQLDRLKAAQVDNIEKRQTADDIRDQREIAAANEAAAQKSEQAWDKFTGTINSAFDSQVAGLLQGTTSWATAFKNVLTSLTEDVIKFFLNLGLKAVESAALQVAAQNSATSGIVAALGLQAAAQTAASKTGALATITTDVGEAYAGFAAFFAPTLGPAALPAAAGLSASVLTTATGIAAFAEGTDYVPRTGLAIVHQGEKIIPANQNGGGSVHNYHIYSNASDPREVAREVARQWNSNPSLRPAF